MWKNDVESARQPLYPMMLENPELRWSFIRKIYTIVSIQLLLTVAVASIVVTVHPIALFFSTTGTGLALYILLIITPFIVLCPLYYYYQRHPLNYFLLGLFTVALAFAVGLTCAYTSGKVILEAVILTTVVVISLTLYTFWAAKRGQDFNFLGPFLFGALVVLMVFSLIQIFFPLGKISVMIYGGLASIVFCGYIVYDTDNLIKRYTYDEYIWAAVALMLNQKNDVEAGSALLYPLMQESPELRWAFIRKVYSILAFQLLLTVAVAAMVVTVHPIALYFSTTWTGLAVYLVIIFVPIIVLFPLYHYHQKHPLNFFLLRIFTVGFGFGVGLVCAFTSGKVILETVIVTTVVVIGLTIYTFWAAKRGQDFAFLAPFLLSLLLVLMLFALFQIFYPMGKISEMIIGGLASIIFCAYIIYDTDTLIKRNSYDEYIWASISLYLDVLNLFLRLLSVFDAANR